MILEIIKALGDFITKNYKSIIELIFGSGLILFFYGELKKRRERKQLTEKLTKEVVCELFSQEIVLCSAMSDFKALIKNPIIDTPVHRFSFIILDSILSSGYFVNFDFKFNNFIFNIYKKCSNINIELDNFMRLSDAYKTVNLELLEAGHRHCIETFEMFQNSNIYYQLKKNHLRKWLVDTGKMAELPKHIAVPNDEKIVEYWNDILKQKSGYSKSTNN